jgi:hypothetical protein
LGECGLLQERVYYFDILFGFCQNSKLGGSSEEGVIQCQQVK